MEQTNDQEKLANLLKKQGLAASAMAAESMAGEILGGRTPGQKFSDLETEQAKEEVQPQQASAPGLTEEQAIKVLQKFTDMFTKEIEKISERLSNVEKQLDKIQNNAPPGEMLSAKSLQEEMQAPPQGGQQTLGQDMGLPPLPSEPQQAPMPPPPQEARPVVQPVSSAAEPEKKEKPSHHPRSAAYDADKYSVDKIFYSGGR